MATYLQPRRAQALLKLKLRASVRASSSVASTDTTVVAGPSTANSSPQSVNKGVKRRRGDEEEEDPRAGKVARDENYVPTEKEPPVGAFGWFMMPVQAFFKGFKESMLSATR